jgi:hypothetical protein
MAEKWQKIVIITSVPALRQLVDGKSGRADVRPEQLVARVEPDPRLSPDFAGRAAHPAYPDLHGASPGQAGDEATCFTGELPGANPSTLEFSNYNAGVVIG